MEIESTNSSTTAKLPILKLGEYKMWVIRIKQYFQIQDYTLREVIENGDSWVLVPQTTQENGTSVIKMSIPATAEEKTNKKNDVKARGLLLMTLSNEHQLTFSQYPDAKSMFAAIETRFGGNAATKKTQKTLLKQQYKNFSASSAESLDSLFNRLHKIVIVWMNKPDVETMSIDDLYNNFKIVEQKVKKTVGTSSGGQNLAFMTAQHYQYHDAEHSESIMFSASPSEVTIKDRQRLFSINAITTVGYDKSKESKKPMKYTSFKGNVGYSGVESEYLKNSDESLVEEQVSQDKSTFVESSPNVDKETSFPVNKKVEFTKPENHEKPIKKLVRNMSPKAVLLKTGLTPLNTVRPVNTAHPKTVVHSAKSKTHFSQQAQSTAKRPVYKQTTLTRRSVHTAKRHYYNGRPNAVNTARNARRHMTENIAYLLDFKEFDGGYVAFGGGTYGGKITSKGTLKTDNLDFEDVYFVNELKFNLFSVSQMCDKKNYVLFTDIECLVLSPNFMLPDENQILLKIPRNDNMYNFDMKNIVPKESLTCLIAKATLDESMLWHRRLGLLQQKEDGIFISQDKYVAEILKKFNYSDVKSASTPVDLEKPLVKDGDVDDVDIHLYRSIIRDSPFELVAYTDSDYARSTQDRKSTTGGSEYVAAASCYGQVLWIQNQLLDYGYNFMNTVINIDNNNLLTKGFDAGRFQYLVSSSGPRCQDTILGDVNAQTRLEITSKQSNDPHLSRGYILGSGEDKLNLNGYWCIILNAAQLQLNAAKLKHQLVLPVQVPAAEGDSINTSIKEIIDFLKASFVHYALTVNPTIYTSCIEQFWATAKVKTVNDVRQIQSLIDKKKLIITETSIRSDLHLRCRSAKSTAWNEFSSAMASLVICLATSRKFNLSKYIFDAMLGDMSHHKKIFVNPSHTKKICANMKREGKDFSRRITPLFDTMMVQASEEVGKDSDHPTDSNQIPIVDQPSTSSPPKKKRKSKRKQRKEAEIAHDETEHEESIPTPSNDPLPSGEDSMQLNDLMVLCTKLQKQVLNLEKAKSDQAIKIASLKKRVDMLEKRRKFRTIGLKRLKKVGAARRIESSNDSLGAQEDATKQGKRIKDIDADVEVTLVNETQERQDEDLMFDTGVLGDDEVFVDVTTIEKEEQNTKTGEAVTTAGVEDSVAPIIIITAGVEDSAAPIIPTTVEETLAQTLMEIKAAKPKVKGIVFHDLEKQVSKPTVSVTQPSIKDKGKGIMQEPERPLTKKDQVALDEDAEIIEEEILERQKQEEANIALIESWENTQAMMEADRLLAERLQTREREELTDEEKGKLFMELMEKRRKHFAAIRAQEKRNRPPTKEQKRNQMSTYLKHMGGYKHNQLKGKSYDEIQKLFDKEMKRVNTFVAMSLEAQESNEKKAEGSEEKAKSSRKKILGKKIARKEKQQESPKRQKMEDDKETNEYEEVEADDTDELKKHLVIVKDDDIAIDAIPLATKPLVIVEYKLLKEGIMVHYQLIRADGSSKRYSSMIRMLQGIDREDLETLWKLVKTKHGDSRPEDEYERVLYGDLKVIFEPDIRSEI
ncbi:hypothetical protein Tco_0810624 [Tanacetum coccineum]